MEAETPEPSYYYTDATRGALGPCQLAQLRVLWVSGIITRDTSIWREGLGSWLPVHAMTEVAAVLLPLAQPPVAVQSAPWYHLDASGQRSPAGLSIEAIGRLVASGELDGMSHVWREGMGEWAELGQVPELRAILLRAEPDDDDDAEEQVFDPNAELDEVVRARAAATASLAKPAGASSSSAAGGAPAVDADGEAKAKRVRKKKPKFKSDAGSNVYVSGLPDDVEHDELLECFKVAGVLKTDPASGAARLKLYKDDRGRPKGDALLTFAKPESVALAVTLRDGYELRPGRALSVQPAKFEQRGEALVQKRLGKDEQQVRKKQKLVAQRQQGEWDDELAAATAPAPPPASTATTRPVRTRARATPRRSSASAATRATARATPGPPPPPSTGAPARRGRRTRRTRTASTTPWPATPTTAATRTARPARGATRPTPPCGGSCATSRRATRRWSSTWAPSRT